MNDRAFSPGFRFSALDVTVLGIGAAATIGVTFIDLWIGIGIAFVVLHFFLFCNILRMSRPLELIWTAVFVALAVLAAVEIANWPVAFGTSLCVTVILAVIEIRRPSYHGVGWKSLNPRLAEWWRSHE